MGRYSDKGIVPCDVRRDTVGPMANNMENLARMDAVICGDWGDSGGDTFEPLNAASGIKVVIPPDFAPDQEKNPGHFEAVELVKTALKSDKLSAEVKEGDPDTLNMKPVTNEFKLVQEVSMTELGLQDYFDSHKDSGAPGLPESVDALIDASTNPSVVNFFRNPITATKKQVNCKL